MELRTIYDKQEEGILIDFKLLNTTSEPQDLTFPSGQQFEVCIIDEDGEEVYRFSEGQFFTMAMTTKNLLPGEALHWQDVWNCVDKNGDKRDVGNYKLIVRIKAIVEEVFEEELIKEINLNL